MESINILIVEDQPILRMDLTYRLTQMGYQITDSTDNGPAALDIYQAKPVDLTLMDIHILGEWDGIETAQRMREIRPSPLIFLTAMTDGPTIDRARRVGPSAYITKPFNDLNLRIAIDLAIYNFALQRNTDRPSTNPADDVTVPIDPAELAKGETILQAKEYVFIKQNYRYVKFPLADVLYLESEGNYTDIQTKTHKYTLRMVLNKVLEKLQAPTIARIHRSYAVNLTQIESFSENEVYVGQHTVPIGRSYRDAFMKAFRFM